MIELFEAVEFLADAVQTHPMMEIMNAIIWLDPLWDSSDNDEFNEDHVGRALNICRKNFVDIYAGVMSMMRSEIEFDDNRAGTYIAHEITKLGFPIDDVEEMAWGIPSPSVGINLRNGETYQSHPEIIPLVELFGGRIDADNVSDDYDEEIDEGYYGDEDFSTDGIEIPAGIYQVARLISQSLSTISQETSLEWFRVNRFIEWVFGVSGNTLIDCTEYDLREMQPLDWNKQDIELAKAVIAEVNPFMIDALMGREILDDNPAMMKTLGKNINRVKKAMKKHGNTRELSIRLDWRIAPKGVHGEASNDPELLLIRSDAA